MKSLVKPSKVSSIHTPHTYIINGNIYNLKKEKINSGLCTNCEVDYQEVPGYIAHYIHQSEEMYRFRKIDKASDIGYSREFNKNLHIFYNEIQNTSVKERYSEQIENYLKERALLK